MNGELVEWKDAKVHVRTDAFMYGANVFEGVRAYRSRRTGDFNLFRVKEHLDRLFDVSMKILRMNAAWSRQDMLGGMQAVLNANEFQDCVQMRPTIYFGEGKQYGYTPEEIEIGALVTAVELPSNEFSSKTLSVGISAWQRISDGAMPPRVKAGANYLNSRYARVEARIAGYDSTILLNGDGSVSEGPGACLMIVRNGAVITPPVTAGILESVTRATIIEIVRNDLNVDVIERNIDRTELYISDEAFFCGTGEEVLPITAVAGYNVGAGKIGRITEQIRDLYFQIVRDQYPAYESWLTRVRTNRS